MTAQKNTVASDGPAGAIAALAENLGSVRLDVVSGKSPYVLSCPGCYAGKRYSSLTVKATKNGTVKLSGTIAGVKVSGSSVLVFMQAESGLGEDVEADEYAVARFFTGKFVIEVVYSVFDGETPAVSLDGGTAWRK